MRITVTGNIVTNISQTTTKDFLLNINHIGDFEPKISSIQTTPQTPNTGTYKAHGKFLWLPWSGTFIYETNDHGFHSEMVEGTLANNMEGGFKVSAGQNNSCTITHYESYTLPNWTRILSPILKSYLHKAMDKELRNIIHLIRNKTQQKDTSKTDKTEISVRVI
jgi:hypothetical protein